MMMKWTASPPPSACLFVQPHGPECRYVAIERDAALPKLIGGGCFEVQGRSPAADLRDRLASENVRARHVVLLLPRSEIEIVAFHLPPAAEAELPELVRGALLQEQDDAAANRVSDFLITHQDQESTDVTVFSLEESVLNGWKSDFKAAGWTLDGVTFSGLGAGELIRASSRSEMDGTQVVIALSDQDLDLVVLAGRTPVLFRTIPWSADEDHRLAERLGEEIPRTLSLAHRLEDDEPPRIHLAGELAEFGSQLSALAELIAEPVSLLDPLDRVQSRAELPGPSRYANLLGVAMAWNRGGLPLNFLSPRRAPAPAGPWRKLVLAGAAVAVLLMFFGARIVQERAEQLLAIEDRQQKLKQIVQRADKSRELQALAAAVSDWRRDDISWIDELRTLAERLPPPDEALVRKMSLSIDAQRNGVIDLSVQVSRPEVVTQLEDALRAGNRSVSSKRVSESDEKSKLPWGFDTRVVFEPEELPDLPAPEAAPDTADATPETENRAESSSTTGRSS